MRSQLQRSVAMVLEAVYEQDFLDCSYGFRPRRSPHQAVGAVWKQAVRRALQPASTASATHARDKSTQFRMLSQKLSKWRVLKSTMTSLCPVLLRLRRTKLELTQALLQHIEVEH